MTIKARQKEYEKILKVATNYMATKESSILYIYGVPGSGKTYTVTKAFSSFDFAYINCNNMHSKSKIYSKIMQSLKCNISKSPYTLLSLVEHLKSCNKPHIIVLDEIDLLKTKTQSILYNIYSLPYYEKSSVLLITMSNSFNLDLDEKIISRIGNNKIMFQTYKSDQLMEILGKNDKITEYLSRRVAAVSGDARKAISLYKKCKGKSVEDTEQIIRKKDNNFLFEFVNSLTKYNKLFLLGYYNEEKVNDAFENFNAQLQMKEMEELEYLEFYKMVTFLCNTNLINLKKNTIIYYHMKEELEAIIKL